MIYLDAAATTKPNIEVINAMLPYLKDKWFNPSSLYSPSQVVKSAINQSRRNVANFINANENEVFFTSGGSESNCWVIQGFINYWYYQGFTPIIITSSIEHKSILECVKATALHYYIVGTDKEGFLNLEQLESYLKDKYLPDVKILVSIQFANNEIGTIQKIGDISKIVHKYSGIFHTDAVQAFGHMNIDVEEMGIDMLSASGHKIGTPKGVGILYKKSDVKINPLVYGTQMDNMRGGTENVPYIIGFEKAVELQRQQLTNKTQLLQLRNYMINQLQKEIGCQINGSLIYRLDNNINVTFKQNITGEALIYLLDMCGIYISSGSACNSHSTVASHVLTAIGLTDEEAMKTIRITLPDDISKNQIDEFIYELKKQIKLLMIDNAE